jgi:hypothetical protein
MVELDIRNRIIPFFTTSDDVFTIIGLVPNYEVIP